MIIIKRKHLFSDLRQVFNDLQHLDQSIVSRSEESSQKIKGKPVRKVEYNLNAMSLDKYMERQKSENEQSETKRKD